MLRLQRYWSTVLEHDFTPHGICNDETYGRLPPLPEHLFTGDFGWLTAGAAGPDAHYMQPGAVPKLAMYELDHRLARDSLYLPASFVTFMTSATLQQRVPSPFDDWRISGPAFSPVEEHGRLLRFMRDSHGADWTAYLYLAADGTCPVLGSPGLYTPELDEEPEERFSGTPAEFADAAYWLAPDFEHFLYRYWVENVIWSHVIDQGRPAAGLPPLAREYFTLLRDPDRSPLDVWPTPLSWLRKNHDQLELW
ncbi:hypothetical protein [Actinoplanes utahensis]|uniref:hypothetical protein n=1 Tax=Actinoplanes utahensis TaxID=1869 RepID=UPI00126A3415|nr:hypothetical protein [Actinoplanes utahensis]